MIALALLAAAASAGLSGPWWLALLSLPVSWSVASRQAHRDSHLTRKTTPGANGCLLWTGYVSPTGYGRLNLSGVGMVAAHRYAYELARGPIPAGLTIDHLCRVRNCVNPDHMEAVTQRENTLRGNGPTARRARVTECPKGHPYDALNTKLRTNGYRRCIACSREHGRKPRLRRKPAEEVVATIYARSGRLVLRRRRAA